MSSHPLVVYLEKLVGPSASFLILREMKALELDPPLKLLTSKQKAMLADTICDNIISHIYSPQKTRALRSKVFSLLGASNELSVRGELEKIRWS
ncbi:MAG: hypothetical protein ACMXYF_01055 [Candidatus Woesearchaeota archaeon]